MERTPFLRLGALIATALVAFIGACTKAEKRSNSGGQQQVDTPSDETSNPCLRFKLDDEEDEGEDEEDHDHEDDEDHEDDDNAEDEDGIGSGSSSSGCDDADPTPKDPKPSPGGGGGNWNAGPGKDGCEEEGKAWIAVNNKGPAVCGAPLVNWCCSEAEIAKRFSSKATELQSKFGGVIAKGLKLYHCSEEDGKTTFHFAKASGGGAEYWKIFISKIASKDGDTKGDNCPNVTMADMGFDKDEGDSADNDIPDSIDVIDDTSKAGLVNFLKAKEYQGDSWTADPTVRDTEAHGKIKAFFNKKLKDSLLAGNDEHDVGSVAVHEIYKDDGTTIDGYSVLGKHKAGEGKDTWFFYQVKGEPDFTDVKAYDVGAPSNCVTCHKSGKDFISSSLP